MLSMESADITLSLRPGGEDGEILEDGEIDDEDLERDEEATESHANEKDDPDVINDEEAIEESEDDDKKRHHKKSHHRRRKRKHEKDDRRSEEKKSRHKKRKGEEASEEGGDSPPSRKKKKRRKHGKKDRESTSPENDTDSHYTSNTKRSSSSPPLPSEQMYGYDMYNAMSSTYDDTNNYSQSNYNQTPTYNTSGNMSGYPYNADTYTQEHDYSSGSDSCYSDFESHLKQYQSYKQNKDKSGSNNDVSDEDNYYSVGFDTTERRRRHQNDDSRTSRRQHGDKRRTASSRNMGTPSDDRSHTSKDNQPVCRYYQEGHCGKGEKCIYRHQLGSKKRFKKYSELCHHYMNGYCQLGDKCNYMHEEYPCRYFHTGTQCISGENCRYSHDPLNEQTKEIIEKFQEEGLRESKEIEELEKAGIKPLQKPPPGIGLLPTPPAGMALVSHTKLPPPGQGHRVKKSSSKIPSIFDIKVEPTPEMQKKIDANTVTSLKMLEEELKAGTVSIPNPIHDSARTGGGLLPIPGTGTGLLKAPLIPNFPPTPSLLGTPPGPPVMIPPSVPPLPTLPPGSATPPWIQRQQAMLKQQQEARSFYENYYATSQTTAKASDTSQDEGRPGGNVEQGTLNNAGAKKKDEEVPDDDHLDHEDDIKVDEDVIRMDDHEEINESVVRVPDFLPAKQKALFMRIHQNRSMSEEKKQNNYLDEANARKDSSADNWTYSSDEEDSLMSSQTKDPRRMKSNSSIQSIMQMISNKQTSSESTVDTKLLSKVADVISMTPSVPGLSKTHNATVISSSVGKTMMSPPQQRPLHRERKSSSSDMSPSHPSQHHHPLRRRLSTSELLKEPATIPLVTKHNTDSIHSAHPDPRMSLSRLFGKTRTEFKATLPHFSKDVILPSSNLRGLRITLSSDTAKSNVSTENVDPRASQSRLKMDPRSKGKSLNDPRLRGRATSITKTSPPHIAALQKPKQFIPPKPTALLMKPSSSVIPSLPELNLDFASIQEDKTKSAGSEKSPTNSEEPLVRLPKLLRGSVRPANRRISQSPPRNQSSKEDSTSPTAPYDPRFIRAAASSKPAPYDPRVLNHQTTTATTTSVPPLYDPRVSNNDAQKRTIPLPKLTPAPGYIARHSPEKNGNSHDLPSGEAGDF
ncbi:uncharacterized protein LOC143445948 [Clavelina lepadiformis]|uniref:uncharacterized protein LOC143445948 n=1 Tax=Clavelina lepadiformis TaxID=159417 RepID=UPI00404382A8